MRYYFPLFLLMLLSQIGGFTQTPFVKRVVFDGIIYDKDSNEPLAYVSIGLKDKPVGTISDSNGHYSIQVNEGNFSDTLLVSLVGYETEQILLSALLKVRVSIYTFLEKTTYCRES